MYNVYAWKYTGYNTVNLPDSPSRLDLQDAVQFPAIDYVQNVFINQITIRATFEEALGIDYIAVLGEGTYPNNAVFYIVQGVKMTSADVAVLSVSEDFVTTAGGLEALVFESGIVIRRSISSNEDVMFNFQTPDPYLTYTEQPILVAQKLTISDITNATPVVLGSQEVIESTIDLNNYTGGYTTTVDSSTGTSVQTPSVSYAAATNYYMPVDDGSFSASALKQVPNSTSAGIYDNDSTALLALAKLRARGIENAIVASYSLPEGSFTSVHSAGNHVASLTGRSGKRSLSGEFGFDLSSYYPQTGHNVYKRIFASDLFNYGILTTAGNKLEASPIMLRSSDSAPSIIVVCDPRSTGRPYYGFNEYVGHVFAGSGNNPTVDAEFFMFCVSGSQWRQIPLVFRGASGSEIIQQKYDLRSVTRETNYGIDATNARIASRNAMLNYNIAADPELQKGRFLTGLGSLDSGIGGSINYRNMRTGGKTTEMLSQGLEFNPTSTFMSVYQLTNSAGLQGFMTAMNERQALLNLGDAQAYEYALRDLQSAQRDEELYALGVQLNNVAPVIAFGGDTNTFRDVLDDGIIYYRYRPTSADVARLNKILKKFGHSVSEPILGNNTTTLNYKCPSEEYDYIQITGAQVGGHKSLAERAGISAQLSGGIRFWHQSIS